MTEARFTLLDAVQQQREHPDTFEIPIENRRENVPVGHYVKLCFVLPELVDGYDSERMWVRVKERKDAGYVGTLENEPQLLEDVARGNKLEFEPEHILQISSTGTGMPTPIAPGVIVGNKILDEDARPAILFRDEPDAPDDSGWFVTAGDEDDEYLEDIDNLSVLPLSDLVDEYPELAGLLVLDAPAGTGWAYDAEADRWHSVSAELPQR